MTKKRNSTAIFTALSLAFLMCTVPFFAVPGEGPGQLPACAVMSWSPEIFTFYGDSETVLQKLESIDRDLLKHRVFAFVVESENGSHLSLFEVTGDNSMRLGQLAGNSFDNFTHDLQNTLLDNDGEKCAGMLAQDLIGQNYDGELEFTSVSRPDSMAKAFQQVADLGDSSYVRATFVLLC